MSVAAWMQCEDMLNKIREELILEAVDTLHAEAAAGRIDIKGNVVTTPDKSGDLERDMFVINNLLEHESEMREKYTMYITEKESSGELDAYAVGRIEELKKFLLALTEITTLMHYSHQVNAWIEDARKLSSMDDPVKIIAATMAHNEPRIELLAFVLKRKAFVKEEVLTDEERGILERARKEA